MSCQCRDGNVDQLEQNQALQEGPPFRWSVSLAWTDIFSHRFWNTCQDDDAATLTFFHFRLTGQQLVRFHPRRWFNVILVPFQIVWTMLSFTITFKTTWPHKGSVPPSSSWVLCLFPPSSAIQHNKLAVSPWISSFLQGRQVNGFSF